MDSNGDKPERAGGFHWRRAAAVVLAAAVIIAVGSWMVRSHPYSGYQAGYETTIGKGPEWIRAEVDAAGGTAEALCRKLHLEIDESALQPHYDYATFVEGCSAAIDRLYGNPVPISPGSRDGDPNRPSAAR